MLFYPPILDAMMPAFFQSNGINFTFSKPTYATWPENNLGVNIKIIQQSNNKSLISVASKSRQADGTYFTTISKNNNTNKYQWFEQVN